MDERLLRRLKEIFSRLQRPVMLLNDQGIDLLTGREVLTVLPEMPPQGELAKAEGLALMRCEALEELVWAVEDEDAGDTLTMADALLTELMERYPEAGSEEYLYRRLLMDGTGASELADALKAKAIPQKLARCVLVMASDVPVRGDFLKTMQSILPVGPLDVLVSVDRNTVAYLMDMSTVEERSVLLEYANAAQESALNELGCGLSIGIGGCAEDLSGLHTSYEEGCRALEIGRTFQPKQSVYDYQSMLMPRFMSELSPELASRYHHMLFNAETARLFSDELLETVSTFFEKDLNLSDTARQLYIHRNTLTYRLDKIAKITGLDLRRFDDAVTFKMLLEMKKCFRSEPD